MELIRFLNPVPPTVIFPHDSKPLELDFLSIRRFPAFSIIEWTADRGTITLWSAPNVAAKLSLAPILFATTNITHKAYFSIVL